MLRVLNIKMNIGHNNAELIEKTAKILSVKAGDIKAFEISKKSLDARDKNSIAYIYSVDVRLDKEEKYLKIKNVQKIEKIKKLPVIRKAVPLPSRPVVVGSGPAGLFAALTFAEAGLAPIVLERGKTVEERQADVEMFFLTGKLNEESNIQFGEGGAGTFSDGKLTTGITDLRLKKILEEFVAAGAAEEILYLNKPHIGTDRLRVVIKNMRRKIISLGGEFYFGHKLTGIIQDKAVLRGVTVQNPERTEYEIETGAAVLAVGHSARDTFYALAEAGVRMEQKPFAVGLRIEHKQSFINRSQYGNYAGKLGAADYKLSAKLPDGRGVYTFCMCPGGVVVPAASEQGHLAVNGMSYYARDGENSNSAVLVSVSRTDFKSGGLFAGVDFQREIEKRSFEIAGGFTAPVQLVSDFLNGVKSTCFGGVVPSYKPSVQLSELSEIFPPHITEALKAGLKDFDKKIKGFASNDAILTAAESRSSSPLRILRDENYNSSICGLIPCGEGAGYAGGIMSAAADGIKCAEAAMKKFVN